MHIMSAFLGYAITITPRVMVIASPKKADMICMIARADMAPIKTVHLKINICVKYYSPFATQITALTFFCHYKNNNNGSLSNLEI